MRQEKMLGVLTGGGGSPYALMSSLMAAAAIRDSKLTKEEKVERAEKRRLLHEERVRKAQIIQNICPNCEGKLIRGKKEKKNNYKRMWICKECGNSHSA